MRTDRLSFFLFPFSFFLLTSACVFAEAEKPAPAYEAEPGLSGCVGWWLHSPTLKETIDAKPPSGAREGQPVGPASLPAGTEAGATWALRVSPAAFVDLRPVASRTGLVWAAVRIRCETAGARRLRVRTFCAARVYKDGQPVLDKPQPTGPFMDDAEADVEFAKGEAEIMVAVAIRSGYCGFQFFVTQAGKTVPNRPVAGDRIVVPAAVGKELEIGPAVLNASAFCVEDLFITPGKATQIELGFYGSAPLGLGPLSVQMLGPDGKPFGAALPARAATDVAREPWRTQFLAPEGNEFKYPLAAELRAGGRLLGSKKLELYSLLGLNRAADELQAEVARRAGKCGRPLPYAALAAEKLKLLLSKIPLGNIPRDVGATLLSLLNDGRSFADAEEAGKDPCEGKHGYFERAYQSCVDEQPQPYFVLVPSAYEPAQKDKRFPLIVFLHGYVPSYDKDRWWDEMPEFNALIDRNNSFLVIPFGRSNTDFQSCGEVDVLDVIAEAKRLYPIDDERVYLYGYSMGGMSVYSIAAHYPDLFAAAVLFCGRADSPLQNFRPLAEFHPFKQWLIHADNPISLCENLVNIPVRIYHGKDDFIINVGEAQRMEKRLKEAGCDAKLTVYQGDHWTGFDIMGTEPPVKWLLEQKRNPAPAKRALKSYSLRFARQAEVEVTAATGALQPIELEWSLKDGAVQFARQSDNIVQRKVNGKPVPEKIEGTPKSPQLCGPVREAICGPFAVVYGTTGSEQANARNKAAAERFAQEWYAFSRSRAILKADKDVTDAEKKNKNLFLFGEEQDNALHAAAAKDLPIAVKGGQVTIGDKTVPLSGKGLLYIYPSPFADAPKRCSVVICAGVFYGDSVGVNHKLDLVPDFLLYTDQIAQDTTSTNVPVCAGFFDGQWKLNPKTTWWFEK